MKKFWKSVSILLCVILMGNVLSTFGFAASGDGSGDIEITMKEHGYTRDDILNASPEEREQIFDEICQSIEYKQKPTIQPRWKSDPDHNSSVDDIDTYVDKSHAAFTLGAVWLYWIDSQKFYGTAYYGDDFDTLILYSEMPDKDERDEPLFYYLSHFYDPDTGKNYIGGTSNTAKTKAVNHYNYAIQLERNGSHLAAMQELGRAIHFLQDVNEPHHAANITVLNLNSTHSAFEDWVTGQKFLVDPSYQTNLYDYYRLFTVGEAVDVAAHHAKSLVSYVKKSEDSQKQNGYADWRYAADECVEDAVQHTAALLYKFALDTGKQ